MKLQWTRPKLTTEIPVWVPNRFLGFTCLIWYTGEQSDKADKSAGKGRLKVSTGKVQRTGKKQTRNNEGRNTQCCHGTVHRTKTQRT